MAFKFCVCKKRKITNKNIYLIGAGFTKAIFNNAPLADEIMDLITIAEIPELHEVYDNSYPDIELFITKADLEYIKWRNKNKELADRYKFIRNDLINQVVDLFDIHNYNIQNLNDHVILKNFIYSIPKNSTILTINYDLILDQALWLSSKWHPMGGYYFPSYIEKDRNKLLDQIILLKLHGSINFRIRDKDYASNRDNFYYVISNEIFKNINSNWNSDGHPYPYALIMSYIKLFNKQIYYLWDKAIKEFSNAKELTIIGCSLRDEDNLLEYAIRYFGTKNIFDEYIINIIDTSEKQQIRIKNKLLSELIGYPRKAKVKVFSSLDEYNNEIA